MFARRNFVHRRQNGGHSGPQGIADRVAPTLSSLTDANTASENSPSPSASSADPTTSNPAPTPVAPSSKTANSSTPSPSAISPSSASVPSSQSAASSTPASASALTSPSAVQTNSTPSSTPLVASPATTANQPAVPSQATTNLVFTPTSSLLPSATSTTRPSGGTSTGLIIGGVAGALAGIAVLGFLLMWCMRRQQNRDIDDFDADAFKRQSAILVDDPMEPPRSQRARPPTMVEHHNASPALAAQAGHGGQNFYGSYDGYGQQPAPPPQGYGAAPMGYTGYNEPSQQLSRQPSNATYLTRQPTSPAAFAPPPVPPTPFDQGAHYIDLNRSSVSPYQAAQYADISRHLGTTDPNGPVPRESLALPDDPLPSPFDDPVQTAGPVATSHVGTDPFRATPPTLAATRGYAAEPHQRPITTYEEADAYGGI